MTSASSFLPLATSHRGLSGTIAAPTITLVMQGIAQTSTNTLHDKPDPTVRYAT
eukprot:CAMPEP_0183319146 /NCGR_PEP_ID=MMETSP0160_2-20130417/62709_1 /TAXON_ID=2839 ORGANISM="Odontella Sinensis, Strain Grunow 1884" /NCGR_SAMPLE_ID=MMETSP0160_2 /ASSEMBLY_ACC=CAM_ASM_000250 /LENGTH=53 /DNA_ID=CAMNT_0025485573 /DNA_START=49 /DNA_END=206 /DNA_ORIENTATION=-